MGAVCVGTMVAMAVAISVVEGAMPTMAVTMSDRILTYGTLLDVLW